MSVTGEKDFTEELARVCSAQSIKDRSPENTAMMLQKLASCLAFTIAIGTRSLTPADKNELLEGLTHHIFEETSKWAKMLAEGKV